MKIPQESELIFYKTNDNTVKIDVYFLDETFWMTQKKMAELFGVQRPAITKHINNILSSNELKVSAVSSKMELTADDGKNYKTTFYNLDMIIAVGYRVNSKAATHFRIWATQTLKEFIIKEFVLDDERLKQGKNTSRNFLNGFVRFGPLKGGSIRRLPISMPLQWYLELKREEQTLKWRSFQTAEQNIGTG